MYDPVTQLAKALGVSNEAVFVKCAKWHRIKSAEVVAEERHSEWQRSGRLPEYVRNWCSMQLLRLQEEQEHPMFV